MSFSAFSSSIRVLFWFSNTATRFSRHFTYSFFFLRHSRAASLERKRKGKGKDVWVAWWKHFLFRRTDKMQALHNPEGADVFTAVGLKVLLVNCFHIYVQVFSLTKQSICRLQRLAHRAWTTQGHRNIWTLWTLQLRPSHHLWLVALATRKVWTSASRLSVRGSGSTEESDESFSCQCIKTKIIWKGVLLMITCCFIVSLKPNKSLTMGWVTSFQIKLGSLGSLETWFTPEKLYECILFLAF